MFKQGRGFVQFILLQHVATSQLYKNHCSCSSNRVLDFGSYNTKESRTSYRERLYMRSDNECFPSFYVFPHEAFHRSITRVVQLIHAIGLI